MERTTITISKKLRNTLAIIKMKEGLKSIEDVIKSLVKKGGSQK